MHLPETSLPNFSQSAERDVLCYYCPSLTVYVITGCIFEPLLVCPSSHQIKSKNWEPLVGKTFNLLWMVLLLWRLWGPCSGCSLHYWKGKLLWLIWKWLCLWSKHIVFVKSRVWSTGCGWQIPRLSSNNSNCLLSISCREGILFLRTTSFVSSNTTQGRGYFLHSIGNKARFKPGNIPQPVNFLHTNIKNWY